MGLPRATQAGGMDMARRGKAGTVFISEAKTAHVEQPETSYVIQTLILLESKRS